jgi:hypothetical protein
LRLYPSGIRAQRIGINLHNSEPSAGSLILALADRQAGCLRRGRRRSSVVVLDTLAGEYAAASEVLIQVYSDASTVRATVSDDGVGGAAPGNGSGLVEMADRVEALSGKLSLSSPVGQGTKVSIELPITSLRTV